jgi:translation initiation factor IF-2
MGAMNFYKDGKLIQDVKGLMHQMHADALGFHSGWSLASWTRLNELARLVQAVPHVNPRGDIVEHLGRAVVRNTLNDSQRGIVANCYVTQGTMKRNDRARIIRDGVVVYPPLDRTARLEWLANWTFPLTRRPSNEIAEIHKNYECSIKVSGYDDVEVGDVIEAFRLERDEAN